MKRNIEFTPALMTYIKQIYGDKADQLSDKTLKNLYLTWQQNPEFLKNAAALKVLRLASLLFTSLASLASRPINLAINIPEIADDDLSAINSFNDAFRIARQKGLKQFKWKNTKANPSGMFAVELKTSKPRTEEDSDTNSVSNYRTTKISRDKNLQKLLLETLGSSSNISPRNSSNTNSASKRYTIREVPNKENSEVLERLNELVKNSLTNQPPSNQSNISSTLATINRYKLQGTLSNVNFGIHNGLAKIGEYIYDKFGMYQQGGQMNSLQEEMLKKFIQFLVLDASKLGIQIQSEQDLQKYVQALGEEGLKAKQQEFMKAMQGGVMARLGAKLEYVKKLKGICPEGYELKYFKQGGLICKVCQKSLKGNKLAKKTNEVDKFKTERAKYKNNMKTATDEASKDSIAINKYNDLEVMINKGHKGNFKNGKWVPDRTKYTKKNACGSKMK